MDKLISWREVYSSDNPLLLFTLISLRARLEFQDMITHHHFRIGWKHFRKQIFRMLISPIFLVLTLFGNSVMALGAVVFYFLEHPENTKVASFLDALWWSVTTVTTVGYGDIIPHTAAGKILGMLLMLGGTAIFSCFTAYFAGMMLSIDLEEIEQDLAKIKKRFGA